MKRLGEGTSDSEIDNLKDRQKELEMLRRNSFFNGIDLFDGFRQQSMVLQQRSGYSQVYRYWIMLQNGLDLIQGDTSVGVQPIWRLYELWCFLKVKQLVCKVLGIDVHNKEHLEKYVHEDTQNAFDLMVAHSADTSLIPIRRMAIWWKWAISIRLTEKATNTRCVLPRLSRSPI